ncbi:uncharacterized protein LOC132561045 [Ylistrum balloti]|uniref:uncharacterized protein LOC132561045 n=1 Tax=Ylistrum balloti TaxID=509963 RepID=UPI002905B0DF|nr:uncharacterized protein LOC132561045 [Ylistrum balloti]XP_060081745.1 uncharacterized protein LOC132561045 [Ylistrum balloti]
MAQTDQEIYLDENDILQSEIDGSGNLVFYVMPDKTGQQGVTDLVYDIPVVDKHGPCYQVGANTILDTDSQLIAKPSASVSLDAKGTVYQYTVPMTSAENYQLHLEQGAKYSNTDKVVVERVNSVEQFPAYNLPSGISANMLDHSTTADIILASAEEPDHSDASTLQVQTYSSQDYGTLMSMPFVPTNGSTDNQTLQIPTGMEDTQILSNFNAETLESLQSLLGVDVDTTSTTTTEELIGSAFDPETTTISHVNNNNALPTNVDNPVTAKLTQRKTSCHESQGDIRRSKRLIGKTVKYDQLVNAAFAELQAEKAKTKREQQTEKKVAHKTPQVDVNEVFMNQKEVNMLKKSVSSFSPDFSSYPQGCKCKDLAKGTDIPIEQIWLHKNQMYYLPQINILVISYEEFVGFRRKDKWYVSVGEITQRLIPNFRNEVESYLVKNVCDKQFLSLEEIEYLKQRKCVNQNMKSGIMISLDTLRVMCKYLASSKAFIQAPTTGLSNAAHGSIYRKVLEKNTRCSKCGGAVKNIAAMDRYILVDSSKELQYSSRIEQKSIYIGEVNIGNLPFQSFKQDELTYISLKEIVECQMFNLQVLQSRLVQLQYRPRPAPTAVDDHFFNVCVDVNQTLWIDLMTLRCVCSMSRLRSPTSQVEVLQQMISRGQYTCIFKTEIIAVDDYDSTNNETVYTLDPYTFKITTKHNYNQSINSNASRKLQRSTSTEDEKRKEVTKADLKSDLSSLKHKMRSCKVTLERSPEKGVVKALSLKPGVYYFSDKNSIVDFLKGKTMNNSVEENMDCEEKSDLPSLSKPVQFRVKPCPNNTPHLMTGGVHTYSSNTSKNSKTSVASKRGYKKKFQDIEMDTNSNNSGALRQSFHEDVAYHEVNSRKENDVSSSVPFYQDIETEHLASTQHYHDTHENYASVSNLSSDHPHVHGQVDSPEVQDKNVDSTAANNAEEELEYSNSNSGSGSLTTCSNSVSPREMDIQSTETQNNYVEFLGRKEVLDDNCDYYSDNDSGEMEENITNSNTCGKSDNYQHSVKMMSEESKLFSPVPSNNELNLPTSKSHFSPKGLQRTLSKGEDCSSVSESSDLHAQISFPFCTGDSTTTKTKPAQTEAQCNKFSSPFKSDKCDILETPDEISRVGLMSPGYGGIFSTPCVSPILDRKLNEKGSTKKMESLYYKCASLDTSLDADKSLHMLATIATDLETLDKTSSQSNVSDRKDPCVLETEVGCEDDEDKPVGTESARKKDSIMFFLQQLLDDVEIERNLPSGKQIRVKFKKNAKTRYPALWKEAGQMRLKKIVKLLALSAPFSPREEPV